MVQRAYQSIRSGFPMKLVASALLLITAPAIATEQEELRRFQIESKPADEALIEFASQGNLTVVFPYSLVKDIQANALQGYLPASDAITRLLADTRLQAQISEDNQIIVSEKPQVPPEPQSLFERFIDFVRGDDNLIKIEPAKAISPYEHIMVRGYRASIRESQNIKRESDVVLDNIQAVEIGKLPDQNLAESLQRIAGVAIDRAEGEGQFVTVRGFGPEFNRVLLNGRQMATDNLGREFSFDTLASEIVSGVNVYKTQNAQQQSGSIGATIDVQTARPLSIPHFQFVGSVKGLYDRNSRDFSPQYSALISNTWHNNRFGALLAFNEQQRDARIDEAQIDGWLVNTNIPAEQISNPSDNIFVPRNYDQRVRFDERRRTGTTLVLQYRPDDTLELVADALHTRLDVSTNATSMGHWFTSSNLEQVSMDEQGTAVSFVQNIGHATDFHARTFDRPAKIDAVGLNVDWQPESAFAWELDWSLSRAEIADTEGAANALSLIGYLNRSRFALQEGYLLPRIDGFESAEPNVVDANGFPSGVSHYLDPSNGRAHVMLRRGWHIQDEVQQFRIDGNWDDAFAQPFYLDFGYQFTEQMKTNTRYDNEANARHCQYCGYFDTPDIPDDFQSVFSAGEDFLSGVSGHHWIPKQWLRHDSEPLFSFLESYGNSDLGVAKRGSSFAVTEQINAAYVDFVLNQPLLNKPFTLHAGLRFEHTKVHIAGFIEQLQRLDILDQTELGPVTGSLQPVTFENRYRNWLPSLNAKWELSDELTSRFAWSRSLTRPTISQLSPGVTLNTTRQGGDLRASSGNTQLHPFESENLDIALEYYYQQSSYLSLGFFVKRVSNFITTQSNTVVFGDVTDPSTGDDPAAPDNNDSLAEFDLVQPQNGEQAKV
ncbi:hypothetical protein MACH26_05100 [Planctobacterium marinum]|uniref:Secretin/TonB short N-terminal domain-containing protein n=2 Tax=Planctobacterium marinum TaxID=1631968 RepID=A0AA48HGN6_9ALTE|nr:hypothetical protein MACH26_05100 [Planctobacterium marinum]